MAPPLITRSAMIDDDGSGEVGTVLNNAWKQELYNQIDAVIAGAQSGVVADAQKWTEVTTTAVGVQNSFNPGISGNTVIRCGNTSLLTITGFPSGTPGQLIRLFAIGLNGQIDLPYYDARSPAAHRLVNWATSAPTSLWPSTTPTRAFAEYQWSTPDGQWVLRAHEQGAWITPAYSAANYSSNAGTFVVEAADVVTQKYRLSGRTLSVRFLINGATITGAPTVLNMGNAAYGGFVPAMTTTEPLGYLNDTTITPAIVQTSAGVANITISRASAAALVANTNATYVQGGFTVEIV